MLTNQKFLRCNTFALNMHMSKALNKHQNVQAAASMHPKHIYSKGQFEVDLTIELNEIAANLRLNCVEIKTFFLIKQGINYTV